ncbi:hypothetical protein TNCV_3264811 [Trichonephila clavipes]|nr:hypothetical protein TNCV_3264811 [Trichonephila clavipes]
MEQSRVLDSPLKDLLPVDSKPLIASESPVPPVKMAHVKKVDSFIHRSPRSRERRNEERRNEERRNEERRPRHPRMYRRPNFRPPSKAWTQCVSETPLCTAIDAHFLRKCSSLFTQLSIKEDSSRRFTSVACQHDGPNRCLLEHISTMVMPVTRPEKPESLEYAARQGQVRACNIYQEPNTKRVFVLFCKGNWYQKKTLMNNFKRAIMEAKHVNEFRLDDVL